jgi:pterin-4a-carbinolamine dehydratase
MAQAQRSMAALLVPLAPKEHLPYELHTTEDTEVELAVLQKEFSEFNARCAEELKEMNQNRITNIIERGGVEGWDTAADLAHLQKSFTFSSTLQGQHFVQNVGKFCTKQDHHPEWGVTDGGKTINVRLTSHFAGNKVTLLDFQLAEHMNQQYQVTQKWHRQYPLVGAKTLATWQIALFGFIAFNFVLSFGIKWGNVYPSAKSRGLKPAAAHNRPFIVGPF